MNRKVLKIVVISVVIVAVIASVAVYTFLSRPQKTGEQSKVSQSISSSDAAKTEKAPEIPDYETPYLEYITENYEYFSRGMMLCDLNDDGVPELFSISYDDIGDAVYYHEFKDGKVNTPSEDGLKTYVDITNLIRPTTFFENTNDFIGIYKNTSTGQKALINSIADSDGNDIFDVITFKGDELILEDESVKGMDDNSRPIRETRDNIMKEYTLSNDKLYSHLLMRGEFGGEHGIDLSAALRELIEEFKDGKTDVTYAKAKDGEFYCYVRNIDPTENEIELIPVATINLSQYNDSVNSDRVFVLNGEEMGIQTDDYLYAEFGEAKLFQMPFFEYTFSVPTKDDPVSVIRGYMGNDPVKVKMKKDMKVRYGVLGEYDDKGSPVGYETLGRDEEYTMAQYLPNFASYNMGSYYKATLKGGKLVFLDVLYRP